MTRRGFFDKHASGWDGREAGELEPRLRRVVELSEITPGERILDVGTGTGVLLPYFAQATRGSGLVLAFDISLAMLKQARQKYPSAWLVQADVHYIPTLSEYFDCVICNAAFPHFEDRQLALHEMTRTLRKGGRLVISHPIGRAAVNALHRAAGKEVGEDRVPTREVMHALLSSVELQDIVIIDEPEFYLTIARTERG